MNNYYLIIKDWYEARILREKILAILLGWAFIYAIFTLVLLNSINTKKLDLLKNIDLLKTNINNTELQITALRKIPETTLYKRWLTNQNAFQVLRNKYKHVLQLSPSKQWQLTLKSLMQPQPNINLVEMKNTPETPYNPTGSTNQNNKIYQQKLQVTLFSHYLDTLNYLVYLEKSMPNIHWDRLSYDVTQYPIGKVQMELSIYYEKN